MSGQIIIKPLLLIEGVFGIHRNYSLLSKRLKCLVICHVLIEIAILIFYFCHYIQVTISLTQTDPPKKVFFLIVFLFCITTATMNNSIAMIFAVVYSKHFKAYLKCIEAVQKLCENDMLFKTKIVAERRRFYFDVLVISATVLAWAAVAIHDSWHTFDVFAFVMFLLSRILECRVLTESVVFYELSEIIGTRLNYLNAAISEVIGMIDDLTSGRELWRLEEEIKKWGEVSKMLVTASDRLRDYLGVQITLSLFCIWILYIILLYSTVNYFINKELLWRTSGWGFTLTMALYLTVKVLILASGQRVELEADDVDTKLARLSRILSTRPEAQCCARAARSHHRRTRTTPVRVRLQDALPARMALLAAIMATVVTNTIVLLQLNHVV